MSLLSAFNNIVINFIEDCIILFPNDKNFGIYKRGIEMVIKYNPRKINTIFKEYAEIYRDKIKTKDETFFLENDYKEVEKYNDEEIFNVIKKLKTYWKSIESNNKDKIWQYLDIMIELSDKL